MAAADTHVAELKRQLEEDMHKLKLQSAAGLPQSHRLYRITSGHSQCINDFLNIWQNKCLGLQTKRAYLPLLLCKLHKFFLLLSLFTAFCCQTFPISTPTFATHHLRCVCTACMTASFALPACLLRQSMLQATRKVSGCKVLGHGALVQLPTPVAWR